MKDLFMLRPDMAFLNHGSFGACPCAVFEVYQQWQAELERQPVEFLSRRFEGLLKEARTALANYLHTSPENLVYINNATTGVNIVARSLQLGPGDEVIGTDHEYGAIDRTWRFLAHKTGLSYINQPIPLPVTSKDDFIERLWQGVTPRTKVLCLSHITSATALIFPLKEICQRARAAGILTIIDGAHAPGQIPLNLEDIGADFYSGNCHKWLCAPKGAAYLYARPEVQKLVEPLVVSWGWDNPEPRPDTFVNWLEWQGTRDIAAFLTVPTAIEFQAKHHWDEVRTRCHTLLAKTRHEIDHLTGLEPICPDSPDWYAQMATIRLPKCDEKAFQTRLWDEFRVEAPLISWQNQSFIRVSVQGYTTADDLAQLLSALKQML